MRKIYFILQIQDNINFRFDILIASQNFVSRPLKIYLDNKELKQNLNTIGQNKLNEIENRIFCKIILNSQLRESKECKLSYDF